MQIPAAAPGQRGQAAGVCLPQPWFFDNLVVNQHAGPLVEETAYYPFGLAMAGISSRAYGRIGSRKLYNGNELQEKEFGDGSGLDFYDFNARSYDQQLGRFMQVDPLSEEEGQESWTPYHFTLNNPIRYNAPDGKCPLCPVARLGIRLGRLLYYLTSYEGKAGLSDLKIHLRTVGRDETKLAPAAVPLSVQQRLKAEENAQAGQQAKPAEQANGAEQSSATTNTKKDRVVNQKEGEKALNQLDGIKKAQDKAKKEAPQGEKQNKIQSTKKSEQRVKYQLKNLRNLNDAKNNF